MRIDQLFEQRKPGTAPAELALARPDIFNNAITRAKSSGRPGMEDLSVYSVANYSKTKCYLSQDMLSGYAIANRDELVSVFAVEKGRGNMIMQSAIANGAKRLACFAIQNEDGTFDGPLYTLYARHGFDIDTSVNAEGDYPVKDGVSLVAGNTEGKVVIYMKR